VQACKDFRKFCSTHVKLDVASAEKGNKTKAPLRRFRNGESKILLVNSGLISEGVDLPDADVIIQVCQNSSDVMSLQILGRILRKPEGKRKSVMIDIKSNGYEPFVRAGDRRKRLYEGIIGEENVKTIVLE
jgi:superfamily II DNA or RNA helicase